MFVVFLRTVIHHCKFYLYTVDHQINFSGDKVSRANEVLEAIFRWSTECLIRFRPLRSRCVTEPLPYLFFEAGGIGMEEFGK
jgi:hypothetical protein